MTDNELGYRIRCWDREGYGFNTEPYNPNRDYTNYLSYYKDKERMEAFIAKIRED